MTEAHVIKITRDHIYGLFPRTCPRCKREFVNLKDFLVNTSPVGEVRSWDADEEDWLPKEPLGIMALANCRCRTTIALSSEGMPVLQLWRIMLWVRLGSYRQGVTPSAILTALRDTIVAQELAEPESQ